MDVSSMGAAGFRASVLALGCAACTRIAADQRTFDGTRWHVVAINGRTTFDPRAFWMSFGMGVASAQFGCNRGGGSLTVRDGMMIPGRDWIITTAACLDGDRMRFEHEGFAVASHPMRMHWTSGRSLLLSNSAGSITLELTR